MAIGDIKGDEAIVMELTAGAAITVGQVVHKESDGKWDPVVDTDTGKFAVAIEAASGDAVTFRAVVWGRVESTADAGAADITQGELVMAATTGDLAPADHGAIGEVVGTMMEAVASSGTGTVWVGLVG